MKYDGNGGKLNDGGQTTHTMPYHTNTPLPDNPFVMEGCTLKGWATSKSNAEKGIVAYTDKQEVVYLADINNTVTLYAVWQPDAPKMTMNASANSMTFDGESFIQLSADHEAFPGLTYTYKWYVKKEGETDFAVVEGATEKTLKLQFVKETGYYKVETTATYQSLSSTTVSEEQKIDIYRASLSPKLSIDGWTYGTTAEGVPKPQLTGNFGGGEVTYYYEGTPNGMAEGSYVKSTAAPTAAGEYKLTVNIAATDNTYAYQTPAGKEVKFTIARATQNPTVAFPTDLQYSGSPINHPTLTNVNESAAITFTYTGDGNDGVPYGPTATPPTAAGTYTVNVSLAETNNYAAYTVDKEFTVARATPVAALSISNWTYGSNPIAPTITGNYGDNVIFKYALRSDVSFANASLEPPKNAGEYVALALIGERDNYAATTLTANFTVYKENLYDFEVRQYGWTYGDTMPEPSTYGNKGHGEVSYSYQKRSGSAYVDFNGDIRTAGAGAYRIRATVSATENYLGTSSEWLEFTIAKANQTPTVEFKYERYGETPSHPAVTGVRQNAAISYYYSGSPANGTSFSPGTRIPTLAGDYQVTISFTATENYNAFSQPYNFKISPKIVNRPWIESKKYNGLKQTATVQSSSLYTVTENNGGTQVGGYEVVLTLNDYYNYMWEYTVENIFTMSGTHKERLVLYFFITVEDNSWTTQPTINGGNGSSNEVEYGGTIVPAGAAQSGNWSVTYLDAKGKRFEGRAPHELGQYKAIFRVYATANYGGLYKEVSFAIVPREIIVTIDDKTITYGEDDVALTANITGGTLIGDDKLNIKLERAAGANAGAYDITGTWENANYAVTFVPGVYTIKKAVYDMRGVSFLGDTVTYDGQTHSLAITGTLPDGVTVQYTDNDKSGAGTYEVTASFTGDTTNYEAIPSLVATLKIEKADYVFDALTDTEMIYDGLSHTLNFATLPTGADGVALTVTYAYSNASGRITNVADEPLVVIATFATNSQNYNVPVSQTATLKIVAKDLTAAMFGIRQVEGETYTYTGAAHSPEIVIMSGVETYLTVNDFDHAYFDNVNAGTARIVFSGKGNYTGEATLTFEILRATFEPTVTIAGWNYGMQANVPAASGLPDGVTAENCTFMYTGRANGGMEYASSKAPTRAGSYRVTLTVAETDNYNEATAYCEFAIDRAAIEPALTIENWTYGSTPSLPELTGNVENGKVTLKYYGSGYNKVSYRQEYDTLTALRSTFGAGDNYTLEIIIAETDNYAAATVSAKFAILRKEIAAPEIAPKVSEQGYILTADVPASTDYTVSENAGGSEGGDYNVVLTLNDFDNTKWADKADGTTSGEFNENLTLKFRIYGNQNEWKTSPSIADAAYGQDLTLVFAAMFGDVTVTYYDAEGNLLAGAPTAAGRYKAVFTVQETTEHTALQAEAEFSILPCEITVTIDDKTITYGEADVALTSSVTAGTVAENDDLKVKLERAAGSKAGTYVITGTWENADYAVTFVNGVYTINKAVYDMTGISLDGKSVTYDGEAHSLAITGTLPDGVSVKYTNNDNTKAGRYAVTATFTAADTENYELLSLSELTATLEIKKAVYDMKGISLDGKTVNYDGEAHSLAITGTLPDGVSVDYTNNDNTNAGSHTVTATFTAVDTENYEPLSVSELTATLEIKKAVYDMKGISLDGKTVTYDGQTYSLAITGTLPDGVSVKYTNNDKANAGSYTVTATFTAAVTENYEPLSLSELTATLEIKKAVYDMKGISLDGKTVTYDGQTHGLAITGTLPAGVSVAYANNENKNAGSYEVTATFTAADTENYEPLSVSELTAKLEIEKAVYNMSGVKFDDKTVVYDGGVYSLEVTGMPDGVSVRYTNNNKTSAGTYTVTAAFTGDDNYEAIADMTATLTIEKAKYDTSALKFESMTLTYDGDSHGLNATGLPAGVSVEYVGNGKKNAGAYEVTAKFVGDTNYESIADMTATLTIEKAKYVLPKFEDMTVMHDGEFHTLTVTGLPYGVTVEYVGSGGKEIGKYEITAKFTGDANYEALADMTATLTIAEKGGCGSMVMDGFTVAGISLATLICAAIALRKAKTLKKKNK